MKIRRAVRRAKMSEYHLSPEHFGISDTSLRDSASMPQIPGVQALWWRPELPHNFALHKDWMAVVLEAANL